MWIKLEVVVPEVVHQGAENATWFHREEFSTIEKRKNKKKNCKVKIFHLGNLIRNMCKSLPEHQFLEYLHFCLLD